MSFPGERPAAASAPVFVLEWGFEEGSDAGVEGTISSYGNPFKAFVNEVGARWTCWVSHYS